MRHTPRQQPSRAITEYQGLFTADILLGNLVGAFLGPWVADRLGRSKAVAIGGAFATLFPILMALVPTYSAQIGFRCILGVPLGFACTVAPMYVPRGCLGLLCL